MYTVNITLKPQNYKGYSVLLDGKLLKFKKLENGDYFCSAETENKNVEINVTKAFELDGKGWFWTWLAYFIIGCFGIFSGEYGRNYKSIRYNLFLELNSVSNVVLTFNSFDVTNKAVLRTCDCPASETLNSYFIDDKIRKRRKTTKLVGMCLWFALIAAAIATLIIKVIM